MTRAIIALTALLCVSALALGCSGGDSDTTGTAGNDTGRDSEPPKNGRDSSAGNRKKSSAAGEGSGAGGEGGPSYTPTAKEVEAFEAPPGGDDSIQTFGDVAEGDEEEGVVDAMRSFQRAIADRDYKAICANLNSASREGIEQFLKAKKEEGDCATVLKGVLTPGSTSEARKALKGTIYEVRVEGENAFVLFTPKGGAASYFVMKIEDGEWRSTSLSTGNSFNVASPPSG